MFDYSKLRGRIVEKFGNITNLSESLGIHKMTASRKLNGVIGFSQADIETWGAALDIDPADYGKYFFTHKV